MIKSYCEFCNTLQHGYILVKNSRTSKCETCYLARPRVWALGLGKLPPNSMVPRLGTLDII